MEITARVTADAKLSVLKDERQVVNFNVAINDSYKPKDSNKPKKMVTYIQCAYWINPGIAKYLTKGTLVELYGRLGIRAYKDIEGEPKATLTLHVNKIKLHGRGNFVGMENKSNSSIPLPEIVNTSEDLPF